MHRYTIKEYAVKDNGFKLKLGETVCECADLKTLRLDIKLAYDRLYKRSKHEPNEDTEHEIETHAFALWSVCDKMQVINPILDSKYVLEVIRDA